MKYEFSYKTDKGLKRKINEDAVGVFQFEEVFVFVVCDGLGGLDDGEVASSNAVEGIYEYFEKNKFSDIATQLKEAFEFANDKIHHKSIKNMATTAVAAVATDNAIYIAHTGDSRALLYHNQEIFRLTKDHSLVQKLVDEGLLSHWEAETDRRKNIVTEVLGTHKIPRVDINKVLPIDGDMIILCSDGLTNMLVEVEIAEVLKNTPIEQTSEKLVDLANQRGGLDNITVVVIEIGQSPYSQAEFDDFTPPHVRNMFEN